MGRKHIGHARHGAYVSDETLRERFLAYIEPYDGLLGCWLWRGADSGRVYGRFNLRGKIVQAHRVAWMLWRGELADGELVLHRCDVTLCCNPRHLWKGFFSDNSRDAVQKGRDRWHSDGQPATPWSSEDYLVWYAKHRRERQDT